MQKKRENADFRTQEAVQRERQKRDGPDHLAKERDKYRMRREKSAERDKDAAKQRARYHRRKAEAGSPMLEVGAGWVYDDYQQWKTDWPVVPPTGLKIALHPQSAGLGGEKPWVVTLDMKQPSAGPSAESPVPSFLADPSLDLTAKYVRMSLAKSGVSEEEYKAAEKWQAAYLDARRADLAPESPSMRSGDGASSDLLSDLPTRPGPPRAVDTLNDLDPAWLKDWAAEWDHLDIDAQDAPAPLPIRPGPPPAADTLNDLDPAWLKDWAAQWDHLDIDAQDAPAPLPNPVLASAPAPGPFNPLAPTANPVDMTLSASLEYVSLTSTTGLFPGSAATNPAGAYGMTASAYLPPAGNTTAHDWGPGTGHTAPPPATYQGKGKAPDTTQNAPRR
ncbi:hypothetical protein [Streptomyces sp. NPDC048277]|uniref:hypothetical protein n=1 Tax=Streptomyces sp. NPDC048277 TaxID=3155027 RepID=UPI0033F4D667